MVWLFFHLLWLLSTCPFLSFTFFPPLLFSFLFFLTLSFLFCEKGFGSYSEIVGLSNQISGVSNQKDDWTPFVFSEKWVVLFWLVRYRRILTSFYVVIHSNKRLRVSLKQAFKFFVRIYINMKYTLCLTVIAFTFFINWSHYILDEMKLI